MARPDIPGVRRTLANMPAAALDTKKSARALRQAMGEHGITAGKWEIQWRADGTVEVCALLRGQQHPKFDAITRRVEALLRKP